jgi:phage/plasmid-like protein (TIGR03299 family)
MAHALTTRQDGTVEFAYLRSDGSPWHGLGQAMDDGANIDQWRLAAGMDWKIQRSAVRYNVERGAEQDASKFLTLPEHHVLFRSDTKAALGVVSDSYKVVQPAEVLEFFRDIAHVGGLELSAAGTLFDGKRFWATAKIGEASPLGVQDKVGGYLLISTSADGSSATEVRRTTVRVVCNNTLQMARAEQASVKITHRSVFNPTQVQRFMGLNETAWNQFKRDMVRLANTPVDLAKAETVVKAVIGSEASTGYKKVLSLFQGEGIGSQLDGSNGTAWGLVNAFTEYADRHVRSRSDANRFVSSQWGDGAILKQKALDLLLPA